MDLDFVILNASIIAAIIFLGVQVFLYESRTNDYDHDKSKKDIQLEDDTDNKSREQKEANEKGE